MRVLIAGSEPKILLCLEAYFANLGHESIIASDGMECVYCLNEFSPDLLVVELDVFWSGCDRSMLAFIEDPQWNDIPVVFFTKIHQQHSLDAYVRVVARLKRPFLFKDLSRLRGLLDSRESVYGVNSLFTTVYSQVSSNCEGSIPLRTNGQGARNLTSKVPSILSGQL